MTNKTFSTLSPVDASIYVERPYASDEEIASALKSAAEAQKGWAATPIAERAALCSKAVDAFVAKAEQHAEELAWQMGRPVRYGKGEVAGFEERARHMIALAEDALADVRTEEKPGFHRFIRRCPLGVALTVAPWNYPYLTAVNSVVPALMAGNAVLLKHATQTPLCSERMVEAFAAAGLPEGLFQYLHLSHESTAKAIASDEVDFVAFTGSVPAGAVIEKAALGRFIGVGLELGGKDPAYVRADADLAHAVENLVDGAFFNSGQSCCGIERIYVDKQVYDRFVEGFAALTRDYVLGNPLDPATTLGPLVRSSAADFVRAQTNDAVAAGAKPLIDAGTFADGGPGSPYFAPQGAGRGGPQNAGHDRGKLRTGDRHHASCIGRRGGGLDERQRVRPDRLGLDPR